MSDSDSDTLQRFLFEDLAARGEAVHLHATWQTVLARRAYPPAVRQVLGEALAAAALLAATIKFDGTLTLQIQASGPLRLLVVQVSAAHGLRGLARWDGEPEPAPLRELCGNGTLVLSIEYQPGREPYQGMVGLHGDSLAAALESYFAHSEQLPTRIRLAADADSAAGLLLQQLPGATSQDPDGWNRLEMLAATLDAAELLALDNTTLVHRLFHQEDLRLFAAEPLHFHCSCSRERTAGMLRTLGEADLHQALAEQGALHVDCEFCGHRYSFDAIDIAGLFTATLATPITRH